MKERVQKSLRIRSIFILNINKNRNVEIQVWLTSYGHFPTRPTEILTELSIYLTSKKGLIFQKLIFKLDSMDCQVLNVPQPWAVCHHSDMQIWIGLGPKKRYRSDNMHFITCLCFLGLLGKAQAGLGGSEAPPTTHSTVFPFCPWVSFHW